MSARNFRRTRAWLWLAMTGATALVGAATFTEDFSTDPARRGWDVFGHAPLFQWDAGGQRLEVTWDSGHSNSYFRRPLQAILAKTDSFTLGFDLYLLEARIGVNPEKPYSFEIALGFHNSVQAVRESFQRGRGVGHSPNLVEFDYFPEYYNPEDIFSHQATVWPTFISTNGAFNYDGANSYREVALPRHTWLRVRMDYEAGTRVLTTTLRTNGAPFATGQEGTLWLQFTTRLVPSFSDFRVDTFAIASYSDAGAGGSLYARGYVDNVMWVIPDSPVRQLHTVRAETGWQVRFWARSQHLYTLETSDNLRQWTPQNEPLAGVDGWLSWLVTGENPSRQFYRVRATRP